MQITHDLLLGLVKALNTDETGDADHRIPRFSLPEQYGALNARRLTGEQIQRQLDKFIQELRASGFPGKRENSHALLMRIVDSDNNGCLLPPAMHEEWWSILTFYLNLPYLQDVERGAHPGIEVLSSQLFIDSGAWCLGSDLRERLVKRATNFFSEGANQENRNDMIVLDPKGKEICIKGRKHHLPDSAIRLFTSLLAMPGEWQYSKLLGLSDRADKIIKRMPPPVRRLIKSSLRDGYRIPHEIAERIKVIP